jgi:hypothetical protein
VLHEELEIMINASPQQVAAIYRNYDQWPNVFPTIKSVRLVREDAGKKVLEIEHLEGRVTNILTFVSPLEIRLEEWKKRYDARFLSRFDPVSTGTRYSITANVWLKGIAKLLEPFLGGYIRRQILRYSLEPVKRAAEQRSSEP